MATSPSRLADGASCNSGHFDGGTPRRPSRPSSIGSRNGIGGAADNLSAPRLADLPPALLGSADPDHLLRRRTAPSRSRKTSSRSSSQRSTTSAPPAPANRRWPRCDSCHDSCPSAAGRPSARPMSPTPSWIRPGTSSATPHRRDDRPSRRSRPSRGCRSTCTSAAKSTSSATTCTPASSRWPCTTSVSSLRRTLPEAPAARVRHKDGAKMCKSRGNVVMPDDYVNRVGADDLPHVPAVLRALGGWQGLERRRPGRDQRFSARAWRLPTSSGQPGPARGRPAPPAPFRRRPSGARSNGSSSIPRSRG